jgi:hypothetical protein
MISLTEICGEYACLVGGTGSCLRNVGPQGPSETIPVPAPVYERVLNGLGSIPRHNSNAET